MMGHIFLCGAIPSASKHPISDNVDIDAPELLSDYILFSDELHHKLIDADEFYDVVDTLQKTGILATDATFLTSGYGNKYGRKGSSPLNRSN